MPDNYQVTAADMEVLGDELALEFSRGNRPEVVDRLLKLRTPEACALTVHVLLRLIGFQHSTGKALYDCLIRRAEGAGHPFNDATGHSHEAA